ncbi:hypothetical protein PIB30_056500 [Stylosanthes scabra]|uniref:Uncharacterized protein n=1 Tax=Stylosanthes scabra TaxID=79078 RepID=A0ABU6VJ67_9FABA|nr:hypothetical protein [Stylosanthes scabra]
MDVDPEEDSSFLDVFVPVGDDAPDERIQVVENTAEWTQMRDTMAVRMFEEWRAIRGLAPAENAHPKKFYTLGKPFPMFQRLGRIFGKDRATGLAAVSGFDAEEQVEE